ncbi:MAG: imidazoleglycerol-phosphate dehydratase [Actinobacteria bacterium]|nr:imidazoleglycerol-phosphate dehydratase [Actinomycetota bacterium]
MNREAAARISVGDGPTRLATGVAILDHLLAELAEIGGFELELEIAPDEPEAEVGAAGTALGEALAPLLAAPDAPGRGVGIVPADEALAMVVVEASGKPLVASNADLTSTRAGGLQTDLAAAFLGSLAKAAGLTIHVRLMEGEDSQHVLSAIFKALGVALAQACATAR